MRWRFFLASLAVPDHTTLPRCRICARSATLSALRACCSTSSTLAPRSAASRSIGLDLETPAGQQILAELLTDADVFLTNFLPDARRRLHLKVDDIRKANPDVIYVRGSAHGQRGEWAEKGGYDGSSFWCRMGSAWGVTPPDSPRVLTMPAGAYGDSMGGMTIAGGIT